MQIFEASGKLFEEAINSRDKIHEDVAGAERKVNYLTCYSR